jgi:drug/metabolite transporter (DMT)-like permease
MPTFGTQEIIAIGGTVVFNSLAQVLLRTGLKDVDIAGMASQRAFGDLAQSLLHPAVLGGIASFAVGLLFWFLAISRLPASVAYPMISLAYITVVVLGWLFLNEQIGWQKLTGASAIIVGVAIIARSA